MRFMSRLSDWLTIGDLARRSGVATSALRFYEERGLISSERTEGNQRRYPRATFRRVAVIRAAQTVGLSLEEIRTSLEALPEGRTPNRQDWSQLSRGWRQSLDDKIRDLEKLRDELGECIGCGCLSLRTCWLFNADDKAAARGPGARYLLGDERA